MRNIESIRNIEKKYKNEWLLIEVKEYDKKTSTSKRGRLLAHSPVRDVIYKKLLTIRSRTTVLVERSNPELPKGMVAAF